MLKVGITGGIGSGKSTVTNMLRGKKFPIVDADIVAREIFVIYPEVLRQIKEEFGNEFFDEQGNIKRKELGKYIFRNDLSRKKLEDITVPFIIKEINSKIKTYEEANCKLCFVDAPTLIENNLHTSMDAVILVWVDSDTQVQRVMLRDSMNLDETMDRIRAQMPLLEKKRFADFIIDNGGSIEDTKLQLDSIITELERLKVEK
ncbi:dephospho-CoA kinase [Clostridium sp. CS001]|uniref:dephospho-CoA kinase n=1 Tax=Clostridium sp. CS001 TaxID=2880648 RepID=UPI001CF40813|nr:dephospho-CoA kinase [Clostridium sp. CS001]MCB2288710.1 dephospho-CoA kinase [Clostridium sp. CS001]